MTDFGTPDDGAAPPSDDDELPPDEDASPERYALGPMMEIMVWREGDTESTIDDALRDGPHIVGEIAAEIAAERGLPADWLAQLGRLAEPPSEDES